MGVLLGFLMTCTTARAAVPVDQNSMYEIPLVAFDLAGSRPSPEASGARQVEEAMATNYEGVWKVYSWNPQTGTPSNVYGSGVDIASAFQSAEDAMAAARSVIRSNVATFRADLGNLRLECAPRGAGKWAVHFQQVYHGIDVWGGKVYLIFTEQGRLFAMGSTYYSDVDLDWNPSIPAADARSIARADLPFDESTDSVEEHVSLLVLPVPLSETQVEHHLVWRVRVHTEDPLGLWVTHVDAHSGAVLWRYNDVHFVDFTGTTSGSVQRPSYCEGQQPERMPYLRIQVAGLTSVVADEEGNWTVPYGGAEGRGVTADLWSPYVDLNNIGGAEGTFSGSATPGVPLQVEFTNTNSQRDEKDVYRAVNDIHGFFQRFDPSFAYASQRITANVSRPQTCNAYWDGTINFYVQGGAQNCANTGEIMGVVQHEFGHGVQDAILGWQGDQGLGEGNGDILSNLMLLDPVIGRGFFLDQCAGGIRNSANDLRYPDDVIGIEIHAAGQVIAGFHWDALERLIATYGSEAGQTKCAYTWHFGRVLRRPTTQPDQVFATFVADDDDGDLTNGTPDRSLYCVGAERHGFNCPEIVTGVRIAHVPLASRAEPGGAEIMATITSTDGALVADSLRVRYRLNGGPFLWLSMRPTDQTDEYEATLPELELPSEVEYYIRALDAAGNVRTAPHLAPEHVFAFDVANVVDPFEAQSGWAVNLEGTDDATTGAWLRADPVGTTYGGFPVQPEDDFSPVPGVICFVTGNGAPGEPAGRNDVDGGASSLYSPVYDLTDADLARAKYRLWYTNDHGNNPGEDIWRVLVRNNGGPWMDVENTSASTSTWVLRTVDLEETFGPELGLVQFKFVVSDLVNPSLVEAAFDDFELLFAASTGTPGASSGPARFALSGSRPNPATRATSIGFEIPVTTRVSLSVYDVSGRLVRSLADREFDRGSHALAWDRTDALGRPVAAGVYYYRMLAVGFTATRSVVVTR